MKKTVYLHIGMPKTGTTFIQRFLYENWEELEKKGVCYPPVLCESVGFYLPPGQEIANLKLLFWKALFNYGHKGGEAKRQLAECWKKAYLPLINASKAEKVVLSAEDILSNGDTSYLPPLFDLLKENGFEVKVIAYIRKPAEYAVSLWGEVLKVHREDKQTCRLDEWLTRELPWNGFIRPIPYDKINYVIGLLGAENVIVRPFEKCQFKNGNLMADFLDIVGVELTSDFKALKPENESYNRNSCELAALINKLDLSDAKKEELHSKLLAKDKNPQTVDTLSDECIERLTVKYQEPLREFAKIYGKESFFVSDFPNCYKKARPAYDGVTFSLDEIGYLHEAIGPVANAAEKLRFLAHDARMMLRLKYYTCRILCNLVPKKARKKYQAKRNLYKQLLSL